MPPDENEPRCAGCGKTAAEVEEYGLDFAPNPYKVEMFDDDDPEWLCTECRENARGDV
jgi:hypothetical protein